MQELSYNFYWIEVANLTSALLILWLAEVAFNNLRNISFTCSGNLLLLLLFFFLFPGLPLFPTTLTDIVISISCLRYCWEFYIWGMVSSSSVLFLGLVLNSIIIYWFSIERLVIRAIHVHIILGSMFLRPIYSALHVTIVSAVSPGLLWFWRNELWFRLGWRL